MPDLDPVKAQYESYPYPSRDPEDERKRLIVGSPSALDEVRHHVFRGRLNLKKRFRALVAGGGTGDAAIMLAQQLVDAGAKDAELTYLDMSTASRAIVEARAKVRGLGNIRFLTGSLLQVAELAPGPYDYIDCCGVLHHLAEPEAGLAALRSVLSPQGGMGLMLYAPHGRAGVYPLQGAMSQLADDLPDAERVALVKKLLDGLPSNHLFKRNPMLSDHRQSDAHLYDLLLHRRDRAYSVEEMVAFLDSAGLRPVTWMEPARYDPTNYLGEALLKERASNLPMVEAAALAEKLSGTIRTHVCYVVASGRALPPMDPFADNSVLVLNELDGPALAAGLRPGVAMTADLEGMKYRAELPPLAPVLVRIIDGKRSVKSLRKAVSDTLGQPFAKAEFTKQLRALYDALHPINKMLVRSV